VYEYGANRNRNGFANKPVDSGPGKLPPLVDSLWQFPGRSPARCQSKDGENTMRGALRIWRKLRWPLLTVAVTLVVYLLGWFENTELATQDFRSLLRGYKLASSQVVVVGITEQCIVEIGIPPLPRFAFADVINVLHEAGAKVICVDELFRGQTTPEEDGALVDAVRNAGNIVLPVLCPVGLRRHGPQGLTDGIRTRVGVVIGSFPALMEAAVGLAHINLPLGRDSKFRSVPIALENKGKTYLAFGIEAATRFLGADVLGGDASQRKGLPHVGSFATQDGKVLVSFSGQHAMFDFFRFQQVRARRFPPDCFRGKVVLIGRTALGLVDKRVVTTPFGELFSVMLHGVIVDNLLQGYSVARQGRFGVCVTLVVVMLACTAIFPLPRVWANLLALGASGAALVSLAVVAFQRYGLFVDIVPPLAFLGINFTVALLARNGELEAVIGRSLPLDAGNEETESGSDDPERDPAAETPGHPG